MELTHFDEAGNARMVDVSEKAVTSRTAVAEGYILVNDEKGRCVGGSTIGGYHGR